MLLILCWKECKIIQPLWKIVWQLLPKQNTHLAYYPAIMLFDIYPKELKIYICTKTHAHMFMATL
jgi:hypothetical protein